MPFVSEITARPDLSGLTRQERFVQALYLAVYGRAGSRRELDAWLPVLRRAGAPAVAAFIESSPEGTVHLVRSWFPLFLGRQAAPGAAAPLASLLHQGVTEELTLGRLLGGAAFYQHAQTLVHAGTPDQRFVQALYRVLLHRTGSPREVARRLAALRRFGRRGVAAGFLSSSEFRRLLFEEYSEGLLHRAPNAAQVRQWVASGLNVRALRIAIEASPAFFRIG